MNTPDMPKFSLQKVTPFRTNCFFLKLISLTYFVFHACTQRSVNVKCCFATCISNGSLPICEYTPRENEELASIYQIRILARGYGVFSITGFPDQFS